jgi:iron complex outermembrane recepter protein
MRISMLAAAVYLSIFGVSVAEEVRAAIRKPINIPAQELGSALEALAREGGIQVIYRADIIGGRHTAGAAGDLTPIEALQELLGGTGLTYRYLNDETVTLTQIASESPAASSAPAPLTVEEVIVSAQKRGDERLQDVPLPVTVLSANALAAGNQLRLRDYFTSIPGLSVFPTPAAGMPQQMSIRGVTTGDITATVGIVIDDVPYGSPASFGAAQHAIPDLDPSDLARIEVLRGPQGTLYGASSLGGLLKFVTVDPSTEGFSSRVQVGTSSIHNADELGYSVRGSMNLPLGDTLAIRASGFTRQDAGYIDNPIFGIEGVNEARIRGGRLSALWRPADAVSLKFSALYQDTDAEGSNNVDVLPGLGELQQSYFPGVGAYDTKVQAYSAALAAKVGGLDIASITGYNIYTSQDSIDFTTSLGTASQQQFGVGNALIFTGRKTDKLTQEVRLSAPIGTQLEWLFGGFFTKEDTDVYQDFLAANSSGAIVGEWAHRPYPFTYKEYAAFADLTWHVTDRFDVQVGGRQSEIRQSVSETWIGPYAPRFLGSPSPLVRPEQTTSSSPFTYLVTPRFKVSSDLMVYARFASGFRPGNVNLATAAASVPLEYEPDMTENYEIGLKGDFLDGRLSVDTSLYYIDWKDIQLRLTNPQTNIGYTTNGGEAVSRGVEWSMQVRPARGLTLATWASYNDADLSQDFAATSPVYGVSGDRLPNSARFSGHLSIQQAIPLSARATGHIAGSLSYVGNRVGKFRGLSGGVPLPRTDFPAYATADLRIGVDVDAWSSSIFVNNVADKRAVIAGGVDAFPPFAFTYIQPRTIGLTVSRDF